MIEARCLQVKEDSAGNVKIACPNAGKDFAAEEISAQVLRKLTDDAAKFLNDKVRLKPDFMQSVRCGFQLKVPTVLYGMRAETDLCLYSSSLGFRRWHLTDEASAMPDIAREQWHLADEASTLPAFA